MSASSFQSVVEIAKSLAVETPDRKTFTFIDDSGNVVSELTCKQVYERALQIASHLLDEKKIKRGDRVLLVYPQGLEFVEAFLACLVAGIIPVPVPAPIPLRPEIGLLGYTAIANDCGAVAQLTTQAYSRTRTFGRILQALKSGLKWPDLPWIITDTVSNESKIETVNPVASDLAFLQYTSGSTRAPRGVCLSFSNLWEQMQLLQEGLKLGRPESTAVFWMPHYHDFALIGGVINALCGLHHYVSFSTAGFLRKPALWGELLNRYRATHMGGPDFGYRLFTLQTTEEQRSAWDFSPMVAAICAAEPIRARTIDEFVAAFKISKLKPESFCPSYGLAEHTVAVTLHGRKRFGDLIGCGEMKREVLIEIVDPETKKPVSPGSEGEIWIHSLSVAQGYFGRDIETELKFKAEIEGSSKNWLRTGDFGALIENELVVFGRLDDMITFRGRNVFPQDAEGLVSDGDQRVRPGRVLAFGIPIDLKASDYQENALGIVLELKTGNEEESVMNEIAEKTRALLLQELSITNAVLIFAPQGTIPKTTSGKLQRSKCKADFLAGRLSSLKIDRGL